MSTDIRQAAPSHLSKFARALWAKLVEDYDFEPVELATLTMALEARDVAATARGSRRTARSSMIGSASRRPTRP